MFTEIITNRKSTPNFFSPNKTTNKFLNKAKFNTKNKLFKFPKLHNSIGISNNNTKKSSLSSSVNILYKSLYPEEKTNLDKFLIDYLDKSIEKPIWKYSLKKARNDDIIRKELMKKNKTMKSYEYLRLPTKLKFIEKRKPNMVRITEDNYLFKYKFILFPWEEEYNAYKKNKNIIRLNKKKFEINKK